MVDPHRIGRTQRKKCNTYQTDSIRRCSGSRRCDPCAWFDAWAYFAVRSTEVITTADLKVITDLTRKFWIQQVKSQEFLGLFQGKEIGHRIADYVDERTTAMLEKEFEVVHEVDSQGQKRARSMGDVWIKSGGIYNPVNVKAGEAGKNGQPNMVSLTKLIDAILNEMIDSYYLLIVKMELSTKRDNKRVITPQVYLVDMLDYLDFITFDSGPGQAMLKEKQFYEAFTNGSKPKAITLAKKLQKMIDLYEDGNRRLLENRKKKIVRIRAKVRAYELRKSHVVDQGGMRLG